MPATSLRARLRATAVTAVLTGGVLVATLAPAPAANALTTAQIRASKINAVMTWAAHQKGKPYRYGAAGPSAFDCSGLTLYVFKHAIGKTLSHNAEAQYRSVRHISRSSLRPGDLVFMVDSSGYAYHVGIYAGNGYLWHAPHSGTVVKKVKFWSARWRFGRIIS